MAEKDIHRKKLVKYLIALRDVGMEAKYHVYDIFLDPYKTRKRKSQFIAVAMVSKDEVDAEDFSALENFTDYLHELQNPSALVTKIIHFERVAFAMNAGERYFFEHGECRIFDPNRKLLFKIIDGESLSECERRKGKRGIHTSDKGGCGVLENMENAYRKIYHNFNNAVVLLFSFYIPCSIDSHECARLLKDFVEATDHELVVGYELIHHYTDQSLSLKWMNVKNITVLSNKELERELTCQLQCFLRQNDEGVRTLDLENDEDFFNDFSDDVHELTTGKHSRYFGKDLCRKILKACNM